MNCGKKEEFEQNQFDFVILTLALWGADGSWKDTVFSAFHALKSGGKLLLVEHDNYYGSNFTRILRKSNSLSIHESNIIWIDSKSEDKFFNKFLALILEKNESFDEENLKKNLETFRRNDSPAKNKKSKHI